MTFKAARVHIPDHDTRPQTCFDLYIDRLLHHLFEASWCLVLLLYFNFDGGFEAFPKVANYSWLIGGSNSVEFYQDWPEIMEVWCPVSGFFQLVLGVPSKLIPDIVDKGLRIPEIFLEKGFEFWPYN